ncbi:MAG: V-type ATP synthase subunit A [Planctomycetota bacterium]|nr:MAG: V-type ATP synthase subunit A [Planctomycetota bacterium]
MTEKTTQEAGVITRANGPIVHATGLTNVQMYEVVEVGPQRLIGEVIRIDGERCVVQVYENTGGLQPGWPIYPTGGPLSLQLGPGLMGQIFDGIQRPLDKIHALKGAYIERGEKVDVFDPEKRWHFTPTVSKGQDVRGGRILGTLPETELVEHRVLLPPGISGKITEVAREGDYAATDAIARVETPGGTVEITMLQKWPVRKPRPYAERLRPDEPLVTGQRIIDTFFPVARGGAAAIPGGFGTGKTMTQHSLAKWCDADIIVYIGCGERGNEMTEVLVEFPKLIDPRSGRSLMERTILVANTSNMPVAAREVSIYTGITLAEYYRDMGYAVAVMADSTSRWAEALRELSARLEEMPVEEGFPAHLPSSLASFYERGGRVTSLCGKESSISIVGSVSPMGGDFSEPVTQHTKRFIRCFWALDTDLANARHYPAINWLTSYSEYAEEVAEWWRTREPEWAEMRREALEIMQKEDKLQQIVKLVGPDVLPDSQRLVLFIAELIKDAFLQQNAFDENDMYCTPEKQMAILRCILWMWRRGGAIIAGGSPLRAIRDLPCVQAILRAKTVIPSEDAEALQKLLATVDSELAQLEGAEK